MEHKAPDRAPFTEATQQAVDRLLHFARRLRQWRATAYTSLQN
jgi:hypothetical protein